MAEIHHFEYGPITPILSYALSVLGSLLALTCAVRARESISNASRARWVALASVALGGTAIWTMHFMAMLGFAVKTAVIRYDVPVTAASAGIAIASVALGLTIVGFGRFSVLRIVAGGLFTGLGVAAMHYTGMAAMRLDGSIGYDKARVTVSVIIAVVASTVALWLAVTVRRNVAIFGSALVMGVAVNGMHFTGMSAMSVQLSDGAATVAGATAATLMLPIVVATILAVIGLIYAVLAAPTDEDRAGAAYMRERLAQRAPAASAAPVTTAPDRPATSLRAAAARFIGGDPTGAAVNRQNGEGGSRTGRGAPAGNGAGSKRAGLYGRASNGAGLYSRGLKAARANGVASNGADANGVGTNRDMSNGVGSNGAASNGAGSLGAALNGTASGGTGVNGVGTDRVGPREVGPGVAGTTDDVGRKPPRTPTPGGSGFNGFDV